MTGHQRLLHVPEYQKLDSSAARGPPATVITIEVSYYVSYHNTEAIPRVLRIPRLSCFKNTQARILNYYAVISARRGVNAQCETRFNWVHYREGLRFRDSV